MRQLGFLWSAGGGGGLVDKDVSWSASLLTAYRVGQLALGNMDSCYTLRLEGVDGRASGHCLGMVFKYSVYDMMNRVLSTASDLHAWRRTGDAIG